MFENIISGDVSNSVLTGKMIGSQLNAILVTLDDTAGELTSIGDLDDISIEMIYKNRSGNLSVYYLVLCFRV